MVKPNESQPVFRVLLRAQPGEVPLALRAFGLRCVAVSEIPGPQPGEAGFGQQEPLK